MTCRISIIIPAYNEARHLGACLDAIASQSVAPWEVIVVDNNSLDRTAAIASSYPFVKLVTEPKQGIIFARTTGFEAARGDVLARIDADTRLPRTWLASVQQFYSDRRHAQTALTGGCTFYNLHTGWLVGRVHNTVIQHVNRLLTGGYFPWGSNCVIPRQCWRLVRHRQRTYADIHEDLDLGVLLRRCGCNTTYRPTLRVGASARRLVSNHNLLWPYLLAWPRTLKRQRYHTWPLLMPIVMGIWVSSFGLILAEKMFDLYTNKSARMGEALK